MDRPDWLTEKRRISEVRYDTLHAASNELNEASFSLIDEGEEDDYQHFLARKV